MEKFLEGCSKLSDGRYRIIEHSILTPDRYCKLEIIPNTIIESNGVPYTPTCAYTFKIWKLGEKNANGRDYDDVVDVVVKEQKATMGLMDHPEGDKDGNPKDFFAVEKNPRVEEGWLVVDAYLLENCENGRIIKNALELDGPIGISSSALGNLSESGSVKSEGFFLERYGDIVTTPSNGYMHSVAKDKMKKEISESVNNADVNLTIIKEDKKQEINSMDTILDSNVHGMLRDAKKADTLSERIEILEDALRYKEKISDTTASKVQVALEEAISEHSKLAEKGLSADKLEEQVTTLSAELEEVKTENGALKESIESLKADHETITELYEKQTLELEIATEKLDILEGSNDELLAKVSEVEDKKMDDEDKDKKDKKDDESEDKKDFKDKDEKKEKKKESVSDDIFGKIHNLYVDSLKSNPDLKGARREIYKASTLLEAQEIIVNFSNKEPEEGETLLDEIKSLRENKSVRTMADIIAEEEAKH